MPCCASSWRATGSWSWARIPERDGESFNIDVGDGSSRDIDFLIAYSREIPGADWGHIGLVGHCAAPMRR